MKKLKAWLVNNLPWLILLLVALLCATFIFVGSRADDGSITLDGNPAKIEDYTKKFIEDSNAALYRIMNEDKPTDEATTLEFENGGELRGLGGQTINAVIGRRLPDGDNDNGKGWQCSKYTAYLATGRREYSSAHPDYGPVNGKDVAAWLVNNFGWKYSDPVEGAIGSGGFNTQYGHTAMYLYSTGTNTAMVNDANWKPLTVATHNMNISGWVWVVPGDYEPTPTPTPEPTPTPTPEPTPTPTPVSGDIKHFVTRGDTLGQIIRDYGYTGNNLFGDKGVAQQVADDNGIKNRGLIYPGQIIIIKKERLGV